MVNQSLVSVIIPVYNGELYLAEAIESVLAQTYQQIEIIVIDDGSTDRTAEIAQGFSLVQYYYQSNSGTGTARNYGVNISQGEFLAFLDADDIWVENKLTLQMQAFKNHPELDIIFGQVQQFYSPGLPENMKNKIFCDRRLMPGCIPSAMLIKRNAFFHVGEFEGQWQTREFATWYIRATELNLTMLMLPELVTKRRIHQNNKGVKGEFISDYVKILKAYIDRKRLQQEVKILS
ncbi:MAG TPA: glycosyltransferase family A protein [Oculatellaceae cyanobacterium]|jgi:glycosyltransferase involved in cell wall biosynthesis